MGHSRSGLSAPPEAIRVPSGLNATLYTSGYVECAYGWFGEGRRKRYDFVPCMDLPDGWFTKDGNNSLQAIFSGGLPICARLGITGRSQHPLLHMGTGSIPVSRTSVYAAQDMFLPRLCRLRAINAQQALAGGTPARRKSNDADHPTSRRSSPSRAVASLMMWLTTTCGALSGPTDVRLVHPY